MKYMVMECHPGYAVLLDENGLFLKAANLNYTVGQIVENPILMHDSQNRKKKKSRWISGIAVIAACLTAVFSYGYYQDQMAAYSSIFLSINPEVRMELNRHGNVIDLEGKNEDGEELIEGYDARGKDKLTVSDELIDRAIEMGFLKEGDQIAFSIDAPDENLFQEYGRELRDEVTGHLDGRINVIILVLNYRETGGKVPEVEKNRQTEKKQSVQTQSGTDRTPNSQPETQSEARQPATGYSSEGGSKGGTGTGGSQNSNPRPASSDYGDNEDSDQSDYQDSGEGDSDYGDSAYEQGNSDYDD